MDPDALAARLKFLSSNRHARKRPPTEETMDPEIHQSLKQSAIIIGSIFAGLVILWILVAGLGL
jgi:hypothetical protein